MIDHCLMHTKNLSQIYCVDGALVESIWNNTSIIAHFLSFSLARSFFVIELNAEIKMRGRPNRSIEFEIKSRQK